MKIMMLLIGHDFPPDIRVEKETRALLAAGHRVVLVCENRKGRSVRENWKGVEIIRLPQLPLWSRRLNTAILFVTLHAPLWERAIKKIVQVEKPDALHVHDLPFIGPGLRIARKSNMPLIADLHENYPAWVQIRRTSVNHNPIEWLAFNPRRFARYEQRVAPRCDYVVVVVEEAAERVKDLGVDAEKIVVVGNTEDVGAVRDVTDQGIDLPSSDMMLLYVGGFGPHRGLDISIKAMPKILEQIPSAMLVIVGNGPDRASLEWLARQLDVTEAVRFEGKQPFAKVHAYIQASDVCLVPHIANPHTNTTMPHKIFQYMYMRKPVVVSNAIPLARVVRESDAGLIFESGNPTSFAHCVLKLEDGVLRNRLGENGHDAVISRHNWRYDAQRLVELYQTIAAS
jgi:glycosyltransferase involved in cell wall biosynthesis